MSVMRSIRRRLKACVAPLIFLSMFAYFMSNARQGDRGWQAQAQRLADLAAAQAQVARAQAELQLWERRVAGLRAAHLDPDALDERTRAMLNLSEPADLIIQSGKKLF